MSTTQASFDGWPLIGSTPGGGTARLLGLGGWISRSLRRQRDSRSQQPGDWPANGLATGSPITAKVQITYADAATAASERRQILSLGGSEFSTFTVTDAAGTLSAMVETDDLSCEPVTDRILMWTMALYAPDPLKYGPDTFASAGLASGSGTGRAWPRVWPRSWGTSGSVATSVDVANAGTATYWPRLRIDGPVTNPTVTQNDSGDRLAISGELLAGQWLDVDLKERRVLLNGQVSWLSRVNLSEAGAWLAVPPGGAPFSWTADAAGVDASLSVWAHEGAYA